MKRRNKKDQPSIDVGWITARMKRLTDGNAVHQQAIRQRNNEIEAIKAQIQSNLGALAVLNEQLRALTVEKE